jgi:hypothetical protein
MSRRETGTVARGRPPKGGELVWGLEGSEGAKKRLELIIETLGGRRTIAAAAEELGMVESAFKKLRERTLREALGSLEPRARGRPRRPGESPSERRLRELQGEVRELKRQLWASEIREELAVLMPHVLRKRQGDQGGGEKKK